MMAVARTTKIFFIKSSLAVDSLRSLLHQLPRGFVPNDVAKIQPTKASKISTIAPFKEKSHAAKALWDISFKGL
ncbi:hypothetical protein COT12_02875 [Candidatus Berkelbacteria bacterium CG08_land_8_20_14_0_20_39_8]|uniref:Uncharacterized protein n=1 Tax=Candidatus Berkelbacteria bacterium CG08_land_8_20_14_0_20_39_8 TaxID=1974511 RepID=A0A2M6YBK6_9BACT|nr:MAG: hypothetical protein COT12_02875 [Candidatus Berkelbacteria bacterium CG08_land_8_20_14_0_20_39_8]